MLLLAPLPLTLPPTPSPQALEKELLFVAGKNVYNIDGDNLRTGLTRDLGFSAEDRRHTQPYP